MLSFVQSEKTRALSGCQALFTTKVEETVQLPLKWCRFERPRNTFIDIRVDQLSSQMGELRIYFQLQVGLHGFSEVTAQPTRKLCRMSLHLASTRQLSSFIYKLDQQLNELAACESSPTIDWKCPLSQRNKYFLRLNPLGMLAFISIRKTLSEIVQQITYNRVKPTQLSLYTSAILSLNIWPPMTLHLTSYCFSGQCLLP